MGKGVSKAVDNVNTLLGPAVLVSPFAAVQRGSLLCINLEFS